jgi:hypothetical protein
MAEVNKIRYTVNSAERHLTSELGLILVAYGTIGSGRKSGPLALLRAFMTCLTRKFQRGMAAVAEGH